MRCVPPAGHALQEKLPPRGLRRLLPLIQGSDARQPELLHYLRQRQIGGADAAGAAAQWSPPLVQLFQASQVLLPLSFEICGSMKRWYCPGHACDGFCALLAALPAALPTADTLQLAPKQVSLVFRDELTISWQNTLRGQLHVWSAPTESTAAALHHKFSHCSTAACSRLKRCTTAVPFLDRLLSSLQHGFQLSAVSGKFPTGWFCSVRWLAALHLDRRRELTSEDYLLPSLQRLTSSALLC